MDKQEKKPLSELMETTMAKIREMVDSNVIVGEPITTPDGVTVIPVSRVSFGFGTGGSDYGKTTDKFGGGGGAGVKIEPVSFLIIKDGVTRVVPVAVPAAGVADRLLDMLPGVVDRVETFVAQKKEQKDIF
ncbi:MAG: GerW family sporulation protein [Oscillospiraceae bacterium]|nr:GerW family sporulation protein [Oscillospiraceae bacterium]